MFGLLPSFTAIGLLGAPDAAHLRHLLVPAGPFWTNSGGTTATPEDGPALRWDDPRAGRAPGIAPDDEFSEPPILRERGGGHHVSWEVATEPDYTNGSAEIVFSPSSTASLAPVSWYARVRVSGAQAFTLRANDQPQYINAAGNTSPAGIFAGSESPFDDIASLLEPPLALDTWVVVYGVFSPTSGQSAIGWDGHRLGGITLRSGANPAFSIGGTGDCSAVAFYDAAHTAEQTAAVVAYLHALPGASVETGPDPEWVPTDADGDVCLWLDRTSAKFEDSALADPADTGDLCGAWADIGGANNHVVQTSSGNRGTVHSSGGVVFAGSHWLRAATIDAWDGDFAVLIIAKLTSNATYSRYASVDFASSWNLMNGPATDDIYSGVGVPGPPYADVRTTAESGEVHSFLDCRVGTTHSLSVDGAEPDPVTGTATVTDDPLIDGPFFVGSDGGSFGLHGLIYKVVVIKNPSSDDIEHLAAHAAAALAEGGF